MARLVRELPAGPLRVVVISGKGGTGKTLISTHLARWFSQLGFPTAYVDADAEAPNGHLTLHPAIERVSRVQVEHSSIDAARCNACGRCVDACAFGALVPGKHRIQLLVEHCRGCGSCFHACPRGAITASRRVVGSVLEGVAGKLRYLAGIVDVGERRAVPVIEAVIEAATRSLRHGIVVIDGPPGNACPMMAALKQADVALLVTETTPFGAHDLAITADTCAAFRVPATVILNRCGLAEQSLTAILEPRSLDITSQIPFESAIAHSCARGDDTLQAPQSVTVAIEQMGRWVLDHMERGGLGPRLDPSKTQQPANP